jgi:hypothetical protein
MIHLPHPATEHLAVESMLVIASKPVFYLLPTPTEEVGYFSNLVLHYISPPLSLRTYSPMKMERTACSETLAFELQTPGNNPKANIRHSKHGESLKSRLTCIYIGVTLQIS